MEMGNCLIVKVTLFQKTPKLLIPYEFVQLYPEVLFKPVFVLIHVEFYKEKFDKNRSNIIKMAIFLNDFCGILSCLATYAIILYVAVFTSIHCIPRLE